jgi:hypothetical protein
MSIQYTSPSTMPDRGLSWSRDPGGKTSGLPFPTYPPALSRIGSHALPNFYRYVFEDVFHDCS